MIRGNGIHASLIGTSQFTVQVSNKTIYLPIPNVLPVHNVPVVHVQLNKAPSPTRMRWRLRQKAAISRIDLEPDALDGDCICTGAVIRSTVS